MSFGLEIIGVVCYIGFGRESSGSVFVLWLGFEGGIIWDGVSVGKREGSEEGESSNNGCEYGYLFIGLMGCNVFCVIVFIMVLVKKDGLLFGLI